MKTPSLSTLFNFISAGFLALSTMPIACAKEIVVLLDPSPRITREEWRGYDKTVQNVINSLAPGDRITLATIADARQGGFLKTFATELSKPNSSLEARLDDSKRIQAFTNSYVESKAQARSASSNQLFDSLQGASQILYQSRQQTKWLVIMTDMMDSRLQRAIVHDKCTTNTFHGDLKKVANEVAPMNGVRIFVHGAGGSGPTNNAYACTQMFWEQYFKAANASELFYAKQLQYIRLEDFQ